MEHNSRIFVAGQRGLAGSAILRRLKRGGYRNVLHADRSVLDLRNQAAVEDFFAREKPEYVFLAAGRVGGILANSVYPAEFIRDNLLIETNTIHSAWRTGVRKLLFLGSSCIYPKFAQQPIREEYLLTSELEATNQWYAVAKIAGIKLCQAYREQYGFKAISLMPTNLYGPGDNFDLENSHVLPALIRKFHQALVNQDDEVEIWGTGSPRREFLHVDDLADAATFLMLHYDSQEIVNVGTGEDITIRELAEMIQRLSGFSGRLAFDASKPDGTPRKLLDVSKISALGWHASIPLEEGIRETFCWYLRRHAATRAARSA